MRFLSFIVVKIWTIFNNMTLLTASKTITINFIKIIIKLDFIFYHCKYLIIQWKLLYYILKI